MILKVVRDVNGREPTFGTMQTPRKIPINDLNEHLTCALCKGYFIDATTIIECLHSFCRSCIVKYLESNKYCPVCDVQVHKSKPLLNIRPDKTLQEIVYKLVPRLFQNEMQKRKEFYAAQPDAKPSNTEQRSEVTFQHLLSPDETICLSFNYHGRSSTPRYLRCPAAVSISHLQKLVRAKYDLSENHHIDILYNQDCLSPYLTLMDVTYIYLWRRKGPMELTYRIYDSTAKKVTLEFEEPIVLNNGHNNNNNTSTNNNNDWKEVQLRISENGEMSVTGIQDCLDILDQHIKEEAKMMAAAAAATTQIETEKPKKELPALKSIKPTSEKICISSNILICDGKTKNKIDANKSSGTVGTTNKSDSITEGKSKEKSSSEKSTNPIKEKSGNVTKEKNSNVTKDKASNIVKEKSDHVLEEKEENIAKEKNRSVEKEKKSVTKEKVEEQSSSFVPAKSDSDTGEKSNSITEINSDNVTTDQTNSVTTSISVVATTVEAKSTNTIVTVSTVLSSSVESVSTAVPMEVKEETKRKLDEIKIEDEPPAKKTKPMVLNHLQNLSNNHPLKKHSLNKPPDAKSDVVISEAKITTTSSVVSSTFTRPTPSLLNRTPSRPGTPITIPKKSSPPGVYVPKPPIMSPVVKEQDATTTNTKSVPKVKPPTPMGYKTLRDPPKTWNPQISRSNVPKASDVKGVRPPKFFKMRNNLPRYLGNPASGVKPMYPLHTSPDKEKKPEKTEIKKHSIVKIDPKTLKPVSERAPETSNLSNQTDLKINTSSVPIFNPLKLQSSPKSVDRKSPQSPKKSSSPPTKRDKPNLSYTPPNPFIPNLPSPTLNTNPYMYPGVTAGFPPYDPRMMAAYNYFYTQRLPFNPPTLPSIMKPFDLPPSTSPKTVARPPSPKPPTTKAATNSSSPRANSPQTGKTKPVKTEKTLQSALEKITQKKQTEEAKKLGVDKTETKPPPSKLEPSEKEDPVKKAEEPSMNETETVKEEKKISEEAEVK